MKAVKQRLASHHVDDIPLYLNTDAEKQDKLTTWLEYLSFQYWNIEWGEKWLVNCHAEGEEVLKEVQGQMDNLYWDPEDGDRSVYDQDTVERVQTVEELRLMTSDAWMCTR